MVFAFLFGFKVQHCAAPLPVGETGGSKGKKNHGRFAKKKRKVQPSVAPDENRFFVVKAVIFLVPREGQSPIDFLSCERERYRMAETA
jgi:hypothetical protein